MKELLPDPRRLSSASTGRTYPVEAEKLGRIVEEAIGELLGWALTGSSETKVRAFRKSRFPGLTHDVTVNLTPSPAGAHTNTRAEFRSASRVGLPEFGQNRRNLDELMAEIHRKLTG
ncbi:MAG: hypothetical protein AVDCRST_MAG80-1550 [uncultured Rubrobacteraceae bacterium]|uniref:DUF1499 domain-containing protein n=1 Tax=uncultured Rubrobacteraceae bacterium TaxID=349277 RepID=A0A6J4QHK2_9ACTN|nr:MAG: hypothetical protein AVDCRST_MAG80-1550 [uncultured Rubrobacteraceae bacterium]